MEKTKDCRLEKTSNHSGKRIFRYSNRAIFIRLVRCGLIEIKERCESVWMRSATEDDDYETLGKSTLGGNDCPS